MARRSYKFVVGILILVALAGCPVSPPDDPNSEGEVNEADASFASIEMRAFTLVNKERKKKKVPVLEMDDDLRAVARAHSQEMAANNYFSHTNLAGESSFDRLENAGITWRAAGENLAYNSDTGDSASAAVSAWINSPEHYENLLVKEFTHTGMGVGLGENGIYFFTQVFIRK